MGQSTALDIPVEFCSQKEQIQHTKYSAAAVVVFVFDHYKIWYILSDALKLLRSYNNSIQSLYGDVVQLDTTASTAVIYLLYGQLCKCRRWRRYDTKTLFVVDVHHSVHQARTVSTRVLYCCRAINVPRQRSTAAVQWRRDTGHRSRCWDLRSASLIWGAVFGIFFSFEIVRRTKIQQ